MGWGKKKHGAEIPPQGFHKELDIAGMTFTVTANSDDAMQATIEINGGDQAARELLIREFILAMNGKLEAVVKTDRLRTADNAVDLDAMQLALPPGSAPRTPNFSPNQVVEVLLDVARKYPDRAAIEADMGGNKGAQDASHAGRLIDEARRDVAPYMAAVLDKLNEAGTPLSRKHALELEAEFMTIRNQQKGQKL